jgi:hypothetical protein
MKQVANEFSRFLFLKPFGLNAPLTGYEAMQHVQNAMIVQMQDPEFASNIENYKESIYFLEMMLPATPTSIPVNAPAWLRHMSAAQQGGKKFNLQNEVDTGITKIGVLGAPKLWGQGLIKPLMDAGGAIATELEKINPITLGK